MSIVCGTDFSPPSLRAARLAGRIAERLGTRLHLVHVIDVQSEKLMEKWRDEMKDAAVLALEEEADRLKKEGIEVEFLLLEGKPDEELPRFALENEAEMIVISALGTRSAERWQVGGSADRITQVATTPVLVVRDVDEMSAWLDEKAPLRVMLGLDRTVHARASLEFIGHLRRAAPCDVTVVHLYWAPEEYERLGFGGVRSIVDEDPKVAGILRDEMVSEVGKLPGKGKVDFRIDLCLGRPGDRLRAISRELESQLVVVGSHRRNRAHRLWNASVSRSVLHNAHTNVACVATSKSAKAGDIPRIRQVLVATDFSETGDAAIRWAYGLLNEGGGVHLVTVHRAKSRPGPLSTTDIFSGARSPEDESELEELHRKLARYEPEGARESGITTQTHVLTSDNVGDAICQAAERLNVDTLVLGSNARGGVARFVLGSVANHVTSKCSRPVLLVRPP